MRTAAFVSLLTALQLACAGSQARAQQPAVTVFAAASLKNALDAVNAAYAGTAGVKVTVSYAATPTLVRQIEQGAPADVFISADAPWMDYAAKRNLLRADSRFDLLGNRLVLVAPAAAAAGPVAIGPGLDLARLADGGRIVTGEMQSVPAGRYAKAALQQLGLWDAAAPRLAGAENVRAALSLVARGEAPLGIVYATDAKAEPGVKVLGVFPATSHPPITYPAALTASANAAAPPYLMFLRSAAARAIFEQHGFTVLAKPAS